MKPKSIALLTSLIFVSTLQAQTQNYFGTSGALNGSVWSTSSVGPYTSALNTTGGAIINFGNAGAMTGGSITVAGINATANMTLTSPTGTISNFSNGIIPISVSSGVTLDFAGQAFTTSATAGYIKNGDGTLILAGGTYGGGFTLNAGTVAVGGANAMGDGGTLTINGGTIRASSTANRDLTNKFDTGIVIAGNFTLGDTTNYGGLTFSNDVALGAATRTITTHSTATFNGIVSGSATAAIIKEGAGALLLGGANTYTGSTQVNGGIFGFRTVAAKQTGNTYTFADGTTLALGSATTGISGGFTDADILKAFASDFTGNLAGITIGSTNNIAIASSSTAFSANIGASARGLTRIENAGNLTLTGANQYSGRTFVGGGNALLFNTLGNKGDASSNVGTNDTIDLGNAARLDNLAVNTSNKNLNLLGATATYFNSASINSTLSGTVSTETAGLKTFTLGGNSGTATPVFSGTISDGSGQLALIKGSAGRWTLSSANTHTGATTVAGGNLIISHSSALQNSPLNTSSSVTGTSTVGITTTVTTLTLGGLTGNKAFGTLFNTSSGAYNTLTALTLNPSASASYVYDAVIANGAAGMTLTKTGAGTQILTGASTYSGGTTVSAGTLLVNNTTGSGTGSGAVTVEAGATFGGTGTVSGATTINGNYSAGTPAVAAGVGTQAFSSDLAFGNGSTFQWDLNANSTASGFDTLTAVGNISVGTGTTYHVRFGSGVDLSNSFWTDIESPKTWSLSTIFGESFSSGSFASVTSTANPLTQGSFSISPTTLTWTAVPEASNLLIGGLVGLGLMTRRRKNG